MSNELRDLFKNFMDNYSTLYANKNNTDLKKAQREIVTHSIRDLIQEKCSEVYKVKGSIGQGGLAQVPWISVYDTRITKSMQKGVYIVYLLNSETKVLYLTLNMGASDPSFSERNIHINSRLQSTERLKSISDQIRNIIGPKCNLEYEDINSGSEGYDAGCIFSKKYDLNTIPDDEKLYSDLNEFLEAYKFYYEEIFIKEESSAERSAEEENTEEAELANTKKYNSTKGFVYDSGFQRIFFGTPGSGKSYKVKCLTENEYSDDKERERFVFRTTFHPDSDYSSFVGCYKPCISKKEKIYSLEELVKEFTKMKEKDELTYVWYKFGARFWASLKCLKPSDIKNILEQLGETESHITDITIGMRVGEEYLNEEEKIAYRFVPQAFTNAYVTAWKNKDKSVFLVIEEINRGNCAQIFGDLFQLLDRKRGVSEFPINADSDLRKYLEDELGEDTEGIAGGKIKLPSNLHIIATMNTSDQSLFPMDSAFKRRWTWECVPIDYDNSVSGKFTIEINGEVFNWHDFLKDINECILDVTDSEDKQMGNFFINGNIDERQFVDKVMFYLWNDVCKEEYKTSKNFFRNKNDNCKEFSFGDLFKNGSAEKLKGFIEYVKEKAKDIREGKNETSISN